MKVLLVTTWNAVCGISEHAYYLKEAVEQADPSIQITPSQEALDPTHPSLRFDPPAVKPDWIILNYHMALHSRWTPGYIESVQRQGIRVLVVLHDSGTPNSDQAKALLVADTMVVHEPADDLPGAHYIRQGIPDWHSPWYYTKGEDGKPLTGMGHARPVVGTVGFPFPWKNYDLLAEASALAGWGLLLFAPGATPEQQARWHALNPHIRVVPTFADRWNVVGGLSACDATAFLYANANTGTSAAIRLGIAARKPVIATAAGGCRQFRDLWEDRVGLSAVSWLATLTVDRVADALSCVRVGGVDAGIVRLAHQDSWAGVGRKYAELLREASK